MTTEEQGVTRQHRSNPLLSRNRIGDGCGRLLLSDRLTSDGRFVNEKAVGFQDAQISGHQITCPEHDDISDYDVTEFDFNLMPIPQHICVHDRSTDQLGHCHVSPPLLNESEKTARQDDDHDDDAINHIANENGNERCHDQDDHDRTGELAKEQLPRPRARAFAPYGHAGAASRFLAGKALPCRPQRTEEVFDWTEERRRIGHGGITALRLPTDPARLARMSRIDRPKRVMTGQDSAGLRW